MQSVKNFYSQFEWNIEKFCYRHSRDVNSNMARKYSFRYFSLAMGKFVSIRVFYWICTVFVKQIWYNEQRISSMYRVDRKNKVMSKYYEPDASVLDDFSSLYCKADESSLFTLQDLPDRSCMKLLLRWVFFLRKYQNYRSVSGHIKALIIFIAEKKKNNNK